MVNFNLHVSGPRIRALVAIANGDLHHGSGIVFNGLEREGLVQFKTVPSDGGNTFDEPFITSRGRTVLGLIEADINQYLSRVRGSSKRGQS